MFDGAPLPRPCSTRSGAGQPRALDGMPSVPAVPEIREVVVGVVAGVARLTDTARGASTAVERANWLLGLRQVADAAEAAFTDILARFDARGDGETVRGARSTVSWCRQELRLAAGDARSRVRLARLSVADPAVGQALEQVSDGHLRFERVRQISHSVRSMDGDPRQGEAVRLLTDLAATADPAVLAAAGRRLPDVVDPDGSMMAREQQDSRRCLTLFPLVDGMTAVDGLLDPEGTATLTAAIAPLMVPAGPDDDRNSAQRQLMR